MNEQVQLRPRDKLLRDTFTPAERLLYAIIIICTTVAFWAADPRSFWILGFYLIIGGFSPIILKTHEHTHPFFIDYLWLKFWLLSAPVWIVCLQFILGLIQSPITETEISGSIFLTIKEVNHWLPTSTGNQTTWLSVLGFASLYLIALNLIIVPKSRSFFERMLPLLCLSAVLVGIFGYIQKALNLESALLTNGTDRLDFFAFFPYDGHWAAFAILWSTVCIALALLNARYDDGKDFVQSTGPWYLTGGTLLGASGFLVQARWPATILLLTFSTLLLIFAVNFLSYSKDKHRTIIALFSGLIGTGTFAGGIFRIFQPSEHSESAQVLRNSAVEMFRDSPIFGWGMDSFAHLIPFYADDTLLGTRNDRAASDILQLLAEVGIVGCIFPLILFSYLLLRYFSGKHNIQLTNHLLIGCLGVSVLTFLDSPFMSPPVYLSFFIVLFSALRWASLSRNKVDEVDAHPTLVLAPSERGVPFFDKPYAEKEK